MKEFLEILGSEIISVTGGIVAGLFLASLVNKIVAVPGLLILLPGFLAMRGNISGVLASKLGTVLHLGVRKEKLRSFLINNTFAEFISATLLALFLGIVAFFGSGLLFGQFDVKVIPLALLGAIFSNFIMLPITAGSTIGLFRIGLNPDDIMGPYITTIGDIVSMLALTIAIVII